MLIYNHAYDIYNCLFRLLMLLSSKKDLEYSTDQIRIFDFILAFPETLNETTLPQGTKRGSTFSKNKYITPDNHKKVFYTIENFQIAALNLLCSQNIINQDKYMNGIVALNNDVLIPDHIVKNIQSVDDETKRALNICLESLYNIPLKGKKGLKERTNIMEYRYDK